MLSAEMIQTKNEVAAAQERLRVLQEAYTAVLKTKDPELIALCSQKVNNLQIEIIQRKAGTWQQKDE